MKLESKETALIVIDMQNYFAHPQGPMFQEYRGAIVENPLWLIGPIQKLLEFFRTKQCPIIFLFFNIDTLYQGLEPRINSAWDERIIEELSPAPDELVIGKDENNGFSNPVLDLYLKERGVKNLVLSGLASDKCVKATALAGAEKNYRTFVVMDAVFPDLTKDQYWDFLKTRTQRFTIRIPPVFVTTHELREILN